MSSYVDDMFNELISKFGIESQIEMLLKYLKKLMDLMSPCENRNWVQRYISGCRKELLDTVVGTEIYLRQLRIILKASKLEYITIQTMKVNEIIEQLAKFDKGIDK